MTWKCRDKAWRLFAANDKKPTILNGEATEAGGPKLPIGELRAVRLGSVPKVIRHEQHNGIVL
jgi:hypothetical protein